MPSVVSQLLKAQITLLNPLLNGMQLETQRRLQDSLAALGARAAARRTEEDDVDLGTCMLARVWDADAPRPQQAMLYLHGGGYTAGTLEHARAFGGMFALETGREAFCLGYRLAPENPFPAALEDALAAYRLMLQEYAPEDIAVVGESAGGGLCFCLCLKLKDEGLPQPGRIVSLSPWADLSTSLEACRTMKRDPILRCESLQVMAEHYLNGHDPRDPLASPLFGDLTGLPPTLILVGGDEVLLAEDTELHEKLLACGVRSQLHVEDGMWHVYPLYPVPEAKKAQAMVRAFLE
ncbi:MAG TPA: alpha/beta hydrolase [Candidatus Limnocylindria bacterium]|nr:alpha/beta hydrolase [Candidatus Limnocylindria bacterium]